MTTMMYQELVKTFELIPAKRFRDRRAHQPVRQRQKARRRGTGTCGLFTTTQDFGEMTKPASLTSATNLSPTALRLTSSARMQTTAVSHSNDVSTELFNVALTRRVEDLQPARMLWGTWDKGSDQHCPTGSTSGPKTIGTR